MKRRQKENTSNIFKLTWSYDDFCSFAPVIEVHTVLQLHSVPQQKPGMPEKPVNIPVERALEGKWGRNASW